MVCIVRLIDEPDLKDPILVEGLPGIGLVANIAIAYLIRKMNAQFFGEIRSSSFQDVAVTDGKGSFGFPNAELYFHKAKNESERDLILLFGNTQALTSRGQYEICGVILDKMMNLGCKYVVTLGGYRPGRIVVEPKLYYAASDMEMAKVASALHAEPLKGEIFGIAGLLVGISGLRGIKSFCLLAETPGTYPDKEAAKSVLKALSEILGLHMDLSDVTAEFANIMLPFDFGALTQKSKKQKEPDWFI